MLKPLNKCSCFIVLILIYCMIKCELIWKENKQTKGCSQNLKGLNERECENVKERAYVHFCMQVYAFSLCMCMHFCINVCAILYKCVCISVWMYTDFYAHRAVEFFTSVCLIPVTCWNGGNNQSGWTLCPWQCCQSCDWFNAEEERRWRQLTGRRWSRNTWSLAKWQVRFRELCVF